MTPMTAGVLIDLNHALAHSPANAYLLYNRACLYAQCQEYEKANTDFTQALAIDPLLAEAYYNRGICLLLTNHYSEGIQDLSKAGELGIYQSYSIIKEQKKNVK